MLITSAGFGGVVFIFLLLDSCVLFPAARGTHPLTLEPRELPTFAEGTGDPTHEDYPEYRNRLVFNGHSFGLPDSWLFLRSPDRMGDLASFTFSSSVTGSAHQGVVEFIDLETDKTGLTPALFISELQELALRRSENVSWELFSTTHNYPGIGGGNPGSDGVGEGYLYYLLKEVSKEDPEAPPEHNFTVVVTNRDLDGELAPISRAFDLFVFQFTCETCSHTPESLAEQERVVFNFIAAHQVLGREHNGRYLPEGPIFHELIGEWRWVSDRPGGFTLNYNIESAAETQHVVSIFKGNYEGEGETYRLGNFDTEIIRGNSQLSVGSAIVPLEFRTLFIPRSYTHTGRDTGRGFLYTQSKFTWNNTDYSLYIQQSVELSFNDLDEPEQTDAEFKEIIFDNRELRTLLQIYIELYWE